MVRLSDGSLAIEVEDFIVIDPSICVIDDVGDNIDAGDGNDTVDGGWGPITSRVVRVTTGFKEVPHTTPFWAAWGTTSCMATASTSIPAGSSRTSSMAAKETMSSTGRAAVTLPGGGIGNDTLIGDANEAASGNTTSTAKTATTRSTAPQARTRSRRWRWQRLPLRRQWLAQCLDTATTFWTAAQGMTISSAAGKMTSCWEATGTMSSMETPPEYLTDPWATTASKAEPATIHSSAAAEAISFGGEGADSLFGESSDNGAAVQGADYLEGGAGNDTLSGGAAQIR